MFEKLSNSWELVKASAAVLQADKELLLFPIISAVLSLLVVATFAVPAILAGVFASGFPESTGIPAVGYAAVFLFYVVQVLRHLLLQHGACWRGAHSPAGRRPDRGRRLPHRGVPRGPILGYACIAATVGMVLRAISERSGFLGRLVVGLFGFAWSLATFLVVPVLVAEDVGPIEAVQRSASYLRRTWANRLPAIWGWASRSA